MGRLNFLKGRDPRGHFLRHVVDKVAGKGNGVHFLGHHHINAMLHFVWIAEAPAVDVRNLEQLKPVESLR